MDFCICSDTSSIMKVPSEEGEGESGSFKPSSFGTANADKSNVVLRRYDKLNDVETSQLLVSGLYLLKNMDSGDLKNFWGKSSSQERSSLMQMIHLACIHFTSLRRSNTITRKKVRFFKVFPKHIIFESCLYCTYRMVLQTVGIAVPPTMPPSPRNSFLPNKKWSSLPSRASEGDLSEGTYKSGTQGGPLETIHDGGNEWATLNTETSFICVKTLANLCETCKGEHNEMRDVIRTTLDVAKASEDTRAMFGTLENLLHVDELASIVFAKGVLNLSVYMHDFFSCFLCSLSCGINR